MACWIARCKNIGVDILNFEFRNSIQNVIGMGTLRRLTQRSYTRAIAMTRDKRTKASCIPANVAIVRDTRGHSLLTCLCFVFLSFLENEEMDG